MTPATWHSIAIAACRLVWASLLTCYSAHIVCALLQRGTSCLLYHIRNSPSPFRTGLPSTRVIWTLSQKALFGLQQNHTGSGYTARAPRPQSAFLQSLIADCQRIKLQNAFASLAKSQKRCKVMCPSCLEHMHGAALSTSMCFLHAAFEQQTAHACVIVCPRVMCMPLHSLFAQSVVINFCLQSQKPGRLDSAQRHSNHKPSNHKPDQHASSDASISDM